MKMPMPAPIFDEVLGQLDNGAFERIFLSGVKASQTANIGTGTRSAIDSPQRGCH